MEGSIISRMEVKKEKGLETNVGAQPTVTLELL